MAGPFVYLKVPHSGGAFEGQFKSAPTVGGPVRPSIR
jgi:hypothetical protein